MRGARRTAVLLAPLAALTTAVAAPAHAVDVPAYGVITITNEGLGAVATWTYDAALWTCVTEFSGQHVAPVEVAVNCEPAQETSFSCPLMVVTTQTKGPAARAGGSATCTGTADTGIIRGVNTAQASGNLGRVVESVTCRAYGGSVPMTPPYTVTCAEPGLPAVAR